MLLAARHVSAASRPVPAGRFAFPGQHMTRKAAPINMHAFAAGVHAMLALAPLRRLLRAIR